MSEKFTCPRRVEMGMDKANGPFKGGGVNLDTYTSRSGLVGQPKGCSFCGSMSGEDFMNGVRNGFIVGVTAKSYKLYMRGIPNPSKGELRIIGRSNGPATNLKAYKDLTRAEKRAVKAEYKEPGVHWPENYRDGYYSITTWGPTTEGKFYTAHLTEAQGWEFDDLWRQGKVNFDFRPPRLFIPGPSTAPREDKVD